MTPEALALITRLHVVRDEAGKPYALLGTIKPEFVAPAKELTSLGYLALRDRGPTDSFDLYQTTDKPLPTNETA